MTAILDEGVPHDLLSALQEIGCDVVGFPKGWKGTKNGHLMQLIEDSRFSCLVTCDKNLPFQQNLSRRPFAVVVLPSNRLDALKDSAERISLAISTAPPGAATSV